MGVFKKGEKSEKAEKQKKKKEKEPQYIRSPLNTEMINYRVYYMSKKEYIINFGVAFLCSGVVSLIFYGGQFRDEQGYVTTMTTISNIVIFIMIGLIAAKYFLPIREKQLKEKRKGLLTQQFRSLLEALAVALSSGMNMTESLISSLDDLKNQYSDDAYIVLEVQEMIVGLQNNIPIEQMIEFLGERSQIEDIRNFGIVFSVCYRAGGNMKDVVRRTNDIISEKMGINEEIETALSSNKTQFNAMMCVPVIMVLLLRLMSSSFSAGFSTIVGVIAMTVAISIFAVAYKLGQKIMDIKG